MKKQSSGSNRRKCDLLQQIVNGWMGEGKKKRKWGNCRRIEYEIRSLNPGKNVDTLLYEYYRKKLLLCMLLLAGGIGGIFCYCFCGQKESVLREERYLERAPVGGLEKTVELEAQIGDITVKSIMIPLQERQLDEEAAKAMLTEIAEKLPLVILGENIDLSHVETSLNLPNTWEEIPVSIFWESSDPDFLKEDGSIGEEEILQNGKKVILTATISYGETAVEKQIPLTLFPQAMSGQKLVEKKLQKLLKKEEETSLTKQYFSLPEFVDGSRIIWKEAKDGLLPIWILLIVGAVLAVSVGKDHDIHKEYEERNRQLIQEYPEIVSSLQLLMSSGMSIRSAFFRMGSMYHKNREKGGRKKYAGEELLLAVRQMENGMGEAEALDFFAERCRVFCYKKLVSLICQNLKRGQDGLQEALMNESKIAFEERKQAARKLGEEAGTKLLFPMMLMMGIVMVILMVPAYFSFGVMGS